MAEQFELYRFIVEALTEISETNVIHQNEVVGRRRNLLKALGRGEDPSQELSVEASEIERQSGIIKGKELVVNAVMEILDKWRSEQL